MPARRARRSTALRLDRAGRESELLGGPRRPRRPGPASSAPASASSPASMRASSRSRSSTRPAPSTATARGWCWPNRGSDVAQHGLGRRLSRGRRALRARRRGVPRRSAPARRRADPRAGGRRAGIRPSHDAGRVGFLVAGGSAGADHARPAAGAARRAGTPLCWTSSASADRPKARSGPRSPTPGLPTTTTPPARPPRATAAPVATLDGEVFRGRHVVEGGTRAEARGILTTKREIKELRERADRERLAADALPRGRSRRSTSLIASAESAILSLQRRAAPSGEGHGRLRPPGRQRRRHRRADRARSRSRSPASAGPPRRSSASRRRGRTKRRRRLPASRRDQRAADEQLNAAQRRLFEAREAHAGAGQRTAGGQGVARRRWSSAASALAVEVARLEEPARELDASAGARRRTSCSARTRAARSCATRSPPPRPALDAGLRAFESSASSVRTADERVAGAPRRVRRAGDPHPRRPRGWSRASAPKPASSTSRGRPRKPTWPTSPPPASRRCRRRSTRSRPKSAQLEQDRRCSPAPGRWTMRPTPPRCEDDAAGGARRRPAAETAAPARRR